jgi:hypothetical protein
MRTLSLFVALLSGCAGELLPAPSAPDDATNPRAAETPYVPNRSPFESADANAAPRTEMLAHEPHGMVASDAGAARADGGR